MAADRDILTVLHAVAINSAVLSSKATCQLRPGGEIGSSHFTLFRRFPNPDMVLQRGYKKGALPTVAPSLLLPTNIQEIVRVEAIENTHSFV